MAERYKDACSESAATVASPQSTIDLRELPPQRFEQRRVFRHPQSYLLDVLSPQRSSSASLIHLRRI